MIEKKIDDLGRIVLPSTFRHKLGIAHGDTVNITISKTCMTIAPSNTKCVVCQKVISANKNLNLCPDCIRAVKEIQAKKQDTNK